MSNVILLVNGTEYAGWKEIQVERSIDTISGAFSMAVSDQWEANAVPWPIKPGDQCKVLADGETLVTGFVDVVNTSSARFLLMAKRWSLDSLMWSTRPVQGSC